MGAVEQTGWTRLLTRTGRYEYQFQGRVPAVRSGRYEDARDYQFLVMDEERWLYRIPVRFAADAEAEVQKSASSTGPQERSGFSQAVRVAEAQLRTGLENYRPRQNAPYEELDIYFAVDAARGRELVKKDT